MALLTSHCLLFSLNSFYTSGDSLRGILYFIILFIAFKSLFLIARVAALNVGITGVTFCTAFSQSV